MEKKLLIVLVSLLAICSACNKDRITKKINLKTDKIEMHHLDTCSIVALSKLPSTYESGNEYHAKVDENGLVKGMFVGNTRIKVSNEIDTKYVDVIIKPTTYLYNEPDIQFGESKESVIAKFGQPNEETSSGILYNMTSVISYYLVVSFDDNNNVSSYGVMIPSELATLLSDFLSERYLFVYYTNSRFLFIDALSMSEAHKAILMYSFNTSYWVAAYAPVNSDKSLSDDFIKKFGNIIQ